MYGAKNNDAGVENNYLRNRKFLCKMSPDEIVGISAYMAEKTYWIVPQKLVQFSLEYNRIILYILTKD